MLSLDQFMDILLLHKQGHSIRHIAQTLGVSRNTVRRALRQKTPPAFHTPLRPSQLDPFKAYLRERYLAHGLSAVRLLEEIRPSGFAGSVQIVRRYLHSLKDQVSPALTVRFETPPGYQAQADWAEVGRFELPSGEHARIYLFIMVLGYSRALYIEFTRSMRLETLIRCHQHAFSFFGGWPKTILYDNMRQVRVGPEKLNAKFRDFALHHGFEVRTHRPYRPRTKGKVERMVSYVRENFLNARRFSSLEDLNAQGRAWLSEVANVRVHATTQARPCDLLEEELPALTAANSVPAFQLRFCIHRSVNAEALVQFEKSHYSVPAEYVGKRVAVEASAGQIFIRAKDCIIAEHPRSRTPGERIETPEHREERWKRSQEPPPPPPLRGPVLEFHDQVEIRSLSFYEEVCA